MEKRWGPVGGRERKQLSSTKIFLGEILLFSFPHQIWTCQQKGWSEPHLPEDLSLQTSGGPRSVLTRGRRVASLENMHMEPHQRLVLPLGCVVSGHFRLCHWSSSVQGTPSWTRIGKAGMFQHS